MTARMQAQYTDVILIVRRLALSVFSIFVLPPPRPIIVLPRAMSRYSLLTSFDYLLISLLQTS